jgi:two-component system heavy metal sensor histidine kinase CusS
VKALSLTARLSLLFALCAATVLLGLGWVVARSVEDHFLELDRHEIEGKLALVRNLLVKAHSPEALAALPRELDDALVGHPGLAVTVLAADGSTWFSTGGRKIPPVLKDGANPAGASLVAWQDGALWYRGLTALAPTGMTTAPPFTVAIALDISHHRHFMAELRRTLALAMALAALVTAVLGWAATRAGLRPLRRLTALVGSLEASGLGTRLSQTRVPTEVETLVVAFNAMLARLEDSFQRLSGFSSDIAHELRTPVSNLMVQTQVALSNARSIEQYREILYSNLEEYERMAQMIGDMLFLAQADNGLLRPSTAAVDLAAEVRALFDYFEAWAEEQGVTLALDGAAAAVLGDRLMLRRAMSNLLANAIRHTRAGQGVRVHLEADAQATRISVENPGVQIPDEHLPWLFDRFYRVDPARRRQGEGAGLGLAIVKSIVTAHGGTIRVTSSGGRTQFLIVLPKKAAAAPWR